MNSDIIFLLDRILNQFMSVCKYRKKVKRVFICKNPALKGKPFACDSGVCPILNSREVEEEMKK